jgi:general secretion pathway protein I
MRGYRCSKETGTARGFSLLEVILALAILTGAIAVIGELVRVGTRNAEAARDLTQAQLLCESKLAEIASGLATVEPVSMARCPDDEDWLYSVTVDSTAETGIVAVRVTLTRNLRTQSQPLEFSMVQWMPDPAAATSTDSTTDGQSSTTGTTGAGNG